MKTYLLALTAATLVLAAVSPRFAAVLRMPQVWAVIGFCALMVAISLWMDRASAREWRDRLHSIERIQRGAR